MSLHKRSALASAETYDLDMVFMEVTNKEIEARAVRLIWRRHVEEIRELDEQIAALLRS